jgi:hypothetical protein
VFGTPALTGTTGTVLITGAIGDYGKTIKVDKAGHPDAAGTYNKLELQKGTVVLDAGPLQRRIQLGGAHAHLNPASCSLEGSVTAPAPILSGIGAYASISGTIKVTFTIAELAPTYASGPKEGECNTSNGPSAQFATVRGTGTVSFK